jgi:hypothetical protein
VPRASLLDRAGKDGHIVMVELDGSGRDQRVDLVRPPGSYDRRRDPGHP